ncbi:MAG TPA: universal stress protein [Methylomirabilota bacterium]|nr:universal stress protein [Methylomirabilota bacterium]
MYKHILVAVDGSHSSDLALHEAINLAKSLHSQLRLVHAVDEISASWYAAGYANPAEIWDAMVMTGRDILKKDAAAATRAGLETDTKLIEINTPGRRIPEVIAEEADAWPADLLIAGTHGRRGLSHMFLGSVAEGIVRVSTRPVLLIRGA